jgi:lysyl-tRNA synthetase class 2
MRSAAIRRFLIALTPGSPYNRPVHDEEGRTPWRRAARPWSRSGGRTSWPTPRSSPRPAPGGAGRWPPRVAAALAALAGLLNLVSALLPAEADRLRVLDELVPGAVSEGATAATAAAGIGLLLLSGGLRRRQRLAWLATVALLTGSAVLNVTKGLDVEEALLEAFLVGLLVSRAGCFTARQGPVERRAAIRPALAVAVATGVYAALGLLANADDVAVPLTVTRVLEETGRMAVGLGSGIGLEGRFGRFFPASVAAVFYLGALLVAARALAPALVRPGRDPGLAEAAAVSGDSLAYFALRDDRASVRAGDALVSWAPVGVVALAAGDPLGPPADWPAAVAAFLAEAAAQGRIAAVLGCGARAARTYQAAGLASIYLGDEAVLDLERFTLEGRAVRIARQSWHRALRAGLTSTACRVGELDAGELPGLRALSARWRGAAPERGFSMALGRLFDPRDAGAFLVVGRDAGGRLLGFLHLVPWGGDGASLDVMRRERDAPAILNDFLVVEAARRLPALGCGGCRSTSRSCGPSWRPVPARTSRCGCGPPAGRCAGCPARSRSSPCTASTRSSPRPGSPATWPWRRPRSSRRWPWPA